MIGNKVKKAVWVFGIQEEVIMPQIKFTANILKKMHMAYAVHTVVHLFGAQSSFKI